MLYCSETCPQGRYDKEFEKAHREWRSRAEVSAAETQQKALEQQEGAYDQHLRQQKALEYQQAARFAAARFKVRTADITPVTQTHPS